MAKYNDLDMAKWREYEDIYSDSLWIINKRDKSGAHKFKYHGNFVPQIAFQLFSRYTKKGDWILDPFMGSGTSLIEAQRMDRNSIGIELQESVSVDAEERIHSEAKEGITAKVVVGDSRYIDLAPIMEELNIKKFQFIMLHPPYWDIIHFSDRPDDISNCETLESFQEAFNEVVDNTTKHLEKNRYCGLVIGDKYSNSQITPLGFICMDLMLKKGFVLKAIIVKNIGDTEAKSNQQAIWRYRALSADYYVFRHEYIMVFKKVK